MLKKISKKALKSICITKDFTIKKSLNMLSKANPSFQLIILDVNTSYFIGLLNKKNIQEFLNNGGKPNQKVKSINLGTPFVIKTDEELDLKKLESKLDKKTNFIPILNSNNEIKDILYFSKNISIPISNVSLGKNDLEYVTDCIKTGWVSSNGIFVKRFEQMFAKFCNTKHAISTSNGTTALHLALLALNIKEGDEVIVPSLTFISTANAVIYTGAKPVFIDSELSTWNIDPTKVERSITSKSKAIVVVHLYGHPADMNSIMKISKKFNLPVIEDAAEAHGAKYKDKIVGGLSDLATFSFYGNKIITTGEGGMITTNNKKYAEKIMQLRDHGMSKTKRYWHPVLGYNYRLTNIQAALGVAQMERIKSILSSKVSIAKLYEEGLKNIAGISLPPNQSWAKNIYWLYSILVEKSYPISRDELMNELKVNGIETRPLFPPIHTQPIYNTGQKLPISEDLYDKGISLPSFNGLKKSEIDKIIKVVYINSNKKKAL